MSELKPRQEQAAIQIALDQETDEVLAERLGICRKTLYRWKKKPVFAHRVELLRAGFARALEARVMQQPVGALEVLTNTPPANDLLRPKRHPRRKLRISSAVRWDVWERDNFTCQHCGARRHLSIDHIVPESKGGPTHPNNLQTLCKRCNSRKGARSL